MDFFERLFEAVEQLDLDFPVVENSLEQIDSIVLFLFPGRKTVRSYYTGAKEKELYFEFSLKTKIPDQAKESFNEIINFIETTDNISSANDSYSLEKMVIANDSLQIYQDKNGFFTYRLMIQANITTFI